jgi:hypothetical protein
MIMTDPIIILATALSTLAALAIVAFTSLKGWREWLALQRLALEQRHDGGMPSAPAGARIEMADLKERIRKLEAIAAGVDL